ncbi:MAG: hypothetical protein IPH06_13515 [Alphaproteobacteria bacterium]|nr:hypothetical protein [Alphaproteobacteria bacterium]QQS56469.1 MAG: hypothetical protein IPN28_09265 [Alphaproteobacteria bacterium]
MSEFEENFSSWQPPKGTGDAALPLEPADRLWVVVKLAGIMGAEAFNWLLHTANYSLVNTVGSDVFLVDALGLPPWAWVSNLTVSTLINGILGLAAVATPIFLFGQLIERHKEIFGNPQGFFADALSRIVTGLLLLLYAFVVVTEFAALYLRVAAESAPSPIPALAGHATGFWPMLLMCVALILINAAMGLATAHILKASRRALSRSAS